MAIIMRLMAQMSMARWGGEGNNNNDPELIWAGAGAVAWTQLDRRNCLIWMDNRF